MTQKYNSAYEIDPEFIPDLEELLCDCMPSFELIKRHEKNAQEHINFAYYLFFGHKTNSPIGFAQIEIEREPTDNKKSFLKTFISKKKDLGTKIRWKIPGSHNEGLVFSPQYIQQAKKKAEKIFNEYQQRDDIDFQEVIFSKAYEDLESIQIKAFKEKKQNRIADTLIKSSASYQEYFEKINSSVQNVIKNSWKVIHQGRFNLGQYDHYKECFAYKTQGAEQLAELKHHQKIQHYLDMTQSIRFITIENESKVNALVFFFEGKQGNCFYDIIFADDHLPEAIPHQLAIMEFFERENVHRLHYLGIKSKASHLLELGFVPREQIHLFLKKSHEL